jgi:hypothetical protein
VAPPDVRGFACCNGLNEHLPVVEAFRSLRAIEPIRDALAEAKSAGWLSVEAFDFTPGPEKIARESPAHLRKVWGHG